MEKEAELKFQKGKSIWLIYRLWDLNRFSRKILEKIHWMGSVKIIAMDKGTFGCHHGKNLFLVRYSRVKLARDQNNDEDKVIESWRRIGTNDQRKENDNNRGVKITEDRVIGGKWIKEFVDLTKEDQSAKQTPRIGGVMTKWAEPERARSSFRCKVKINKY